MKKTSVGILGSVLFMIAVLGVFYYFWSGSMRDAELSQSDVAASYSVVDISGIANQAESLASRSENNAGLPIPEPNEKMGKSNPFNAPE